MKVAGFVEQSVGESASKHTSMEREPPVVPESSSEIVKIRTRIQKALEVLQGFFLFISQNCSSRPFHFRIVSHCCRVPSISLAGGRTGTRVCHAIRNVSLRRWCECQNHRLEVLSHNLANINTPGSSHIWRCCKLDIPKRLIVVKYRLVTEPWKTLMAVSKSAVVDTIQSRAHRSDQAQDRLCDQR